MDDKPGDQMLHVDAATLQELVQHVWVIPASWHPVTRAVITPDTWPNTDPTLTAFHAPKEDKHDALSHNQA